MKLLGTLALPLALAAGVIGCATIRPSVTWWDGYRYVVILRSPGDSFDIGDKLSAELQRSGMEIIGRDQTQRKDLVHDQELETVIVSYAYNDSSARPFLGVALRDYSTGVLLWDGATHPAGDGDVQYTWADKDFGFSSVEERLDGMIRDFGVWFRQRHVTFIADAVLLRPKWWTNEKRRTSD